MVGNHGRPNAEMMRLRDMLDRAGIEWHDDSDGVFCRTAQLSDGEIVFSAVCGPYAYGNIELWTGTMLEAKEDPVGLATAAEAFELIRKEVGA